MQEKILALYELQKIDSKIDEINKVKGELPLEVQDLEDEMAGMKTRIEHINAEIEELNTLSKQRKREVDQAKIMIGNYKEQQNNVRNGLAVVTVKRDACGGCFNRIPPQRQVDIRQGKKIIICEYCGRILVADPEESQE